MLSFIICKISNGNILQVLKHNIVNSRVPIGHKIPETILVSRTTNMMIIYLHPQCAFIIVLIEFTVATLYITVWTRIFSLADCMKSVCWTNTTRLATAVVEAVRQSL